MTLIITGRIVNNILVLYDSATGNTKKMAEFVAEGVSQSDEINLRVKSIR